MYTSPPYARDKGQRLKKYQRRDAKRLWLEHYIRHPDSEYPHVARCCEAIGISRAAYYNWLKTDALFKRKVDAIGAVWFSDWLPTEEAKQKHRKLQQYGRELIKYDERKQSQK